MTLVYIALVVLALSFSFYCGISIEKKKNVESDLSDIRKADKVIADAEKEFDKKYLKK